jgi:hypothetical protein
MRIQQGVCHHKDRLAKILIALGLFLVEQFTPTLRIRDLTYSPHSSRGAMYGGNGMVARFSTHAKPDSQLASIESN